MSSRTRPSKAAVRRCTKCGKPTDNYCQICKADMCENCLIDHSHEMDK